MSQALFNSTGGQYDQTAVLDDRGRFSRDLYAQVGSARFSATNALFLIVDNLRSVSDASDVNPHAEITLQVVLERL